MSPEKGLTIYFKPEIQSQVDRQFKSNLLLLIIKKTETENVGHCAN